MVDMLSKAARIMAPASIPQGRQPGGRDANVRSRISQTLQCRGCHA